MRKHKITRIVAMHYVKLTYRSALFLLTLGVYIHNRLRGSMEPFGGLENNRLLMSAAWLVFFFEMVLRFFPDRVESMGCQKQFRRNYSPRGTNADRLSARPAKTSSVIAVIASWLALNGAIAALYFINIIDAGILLLVALLYSVCDVICILFFCPFQTWFLKNKCCATCRIYNWDYAMMCTPLLFIKNVYALSLAALSLILLIEWEIMLYLHPERFCEATNSTLSCAACREKLCHHKRQLRRFLEDGKFNLTGNALFKQVRDKTRRHK